MAIFSKEFVEKINKVTNRIHDILSDSLSTFYLHVLIVICLYIGMSIVVVFGNIGVNTWWSQYSATNPHVIIELTVQYWFFIIGCFALKVALVAETIYICALTYVLVIRCKIEGTNCNSTKPDTVTESSEELPAPHCPRCQETMELIKNGSRNGGNRYFCKSCRKYFTRKEDQ